jgi:hypothetical protein
MSKVGDRNVLDILDLDLPVWRIVPMDRFLGMLVTKKDTLSNPGTWDDKYESLVLHRATIEDRHGQAISLDNFAERWFAQCWCKLEESDAMWRIYSPDRRGVRVASTIRRVFDNVVAGVPGKDPDRECFVGEVNYFDKAGIQAMAGGISLTSLISGGQNDGFARTLCLKREAFSHESEVRVMYDDYATKTPGTAGGYLPFALDPNAVFDPEVLLDPRLKPHELATHEALIRALGWHGTVKQSTLYEVPAFVIRE